MIKHLPTVTQPEMISSPLQHSASEVPITSLLPMNSPKPPPALSNYPAETKSSEQSAVKIEKREDKEEAEKKAKHARRNRRYYGAERRPYGANGGGPWEIWEEFDEEEGGKDDDGGVVRSVFRRRYR